MVLITWRPIFVTMKSLKKFPNYQISKEGFVFNKKNKKLKHYVSKSGYASVTLYNSNGNKKFRVHRLIAQCYIDNDLNKPYVNHKDGNKLNNHFDNLEWCTAKENTKHAIEHNLIRFTNGKNHKLSKKILAIHQNGDIKTFYGTRDIERKTGILRKYVCRVLNKKRQHHKGVVYKYAN